jgi:hypothetical protein
MSGWRVATALVVAAFATKPAAGAPPATKPAPARPARPAAKPPAPRPRPPPPLALLPSIARVKVTSHEKAIAVVEDVSLPRGEWKGESLRFHVAFVAPGPRAIDAHLLEVGDGELEAEDDEVGEPLPIERAPRRPPDAHPLLGRESMAGVVITVPGASLAKALARGDMASLRIRSLVDVAELDASGASSVVVRLGASRGTPLTVGRVVAGAAPPAAPLAKVEARLCGPDADPHLLAVGQVPRPDRTDGEAPIAPVLAVRHATDDLCVRLWHAEPKP